MIFFLTTYAQAVQNDQGDYVIIVRINLHQTTELILTIYEIQYDKYLQKVIKNVCELSAVATIVT